MSQDEQVIMSQGTTPTLVLVVDESDLTQARIKVTIEQNGRQINFSNDRIESMLDDQNTILMIHLTQRETLDLRPTEGDVQVRWVNPDGEAYITEIETIEIAKALYKGVIQHE